MNLISSVLTKENITFFLACLGSIGTLYTLIYTVNSRRIHFSVEVIDHAVRANGIVQLFLYIGNDSSLPLCIPFIYLKCGSTSVECELIEKKALFRGELLYRTPLFPLNLAAHTSGIYFIEFLNCPDIELIPDKTISLEFRTNRGVISRSPVLPPISHYLHMPRKSPLSRRGGLE